MPASNGMQVPGEASPVEHAIVGLNELSKVQSPCGSDPLKRTNQEPSVQRREQSLLERPFEINKFGRDGLPHEVGAKVEEPKTVLYLAYGSNLCKETFLGQRKIRPIGAINVVAPDLKLTFDLPGIPYTEPCFGNTRYRHESTPFVGTSDKTSMLPSFDSKHIFHNPQWPKGLVGVVYEVILADYVRIIATEGGGAAYKDILVDCYPLPTGTQHVPSEPDSQVFKAHTLYSPVYPPGKAPPGKDAIFSRPEPGYAQPSARYLKLITDGADEHCFPADYKAYLHELKPYTTTSLRQKIGGIVFRGIWLPIITFVFALNRICRDNDGKAPKWLATITGAMFKGVWLSYDGFFRAIFGDGERTQE